MKVICAWCKKQLPDKDGKGIEGTSHGMCPECLEKELKKLEVTDGKDNKG